MEGGFGLYIRAMIEVRLSQYTVHEAYELKRSHRPSFQFVWYTKRDSVGRILEKWSDPQKCFLLLCLN